MTPTIVPSLYDFPHWRIGTVVIYQLLVITATTVGFGSNHSFRVDLSTAVAEGVEDFVDFEIPLTRQHTNHSVYGHAFSDPTGCNYRGVLRIDLGKGGYNKIRLHFIFHVPILWSLHLSQSKSSRGYGTGSDDAELQLFNQQMRIYSSAKHAGHRSTSLDGQRLLRVADRAVRAVGKTTLMLQLEQDDLRWASKRGQRAFNRDHLNYPFLFDFKSSLMNNSVLFIGLNRAVGLDSRYGFGLCSVRGDIYSSRGRRNSCQQVCDANADCSSARPDSEPLCRCKEGFAGDGLKYNCHDVNECTQDNGGCVHICRNTEGSYRCECYPGFQKHSNGRDCLDVNECALNNGGCEQQCINVIGGFRCRCREGFRLGLNGRSCIKVYKNETCARLQCSQGCHESSGVCFCQSGYQLSRDRRTCAPTCQVENGGCQHKCYQVNGRPQCNCHSQFVLGRDRRSCLPSCAIDNGGCDDVCIDSRYGVRCNCTTGKTLLPDGRSCQDVDHCGDHTCAHICENRDYGHECSCSILDVDHCGDHTCAHICENRDYGHECSCRPGYMLLTDRKTCVDIDECKLAGICDHECRNLPGSYECRCRPGYVGYMNNTSCEDMNECSIMNGGCSHQCRNLPSGYSCECPAGQHLHFNGKDCEEDVPCPVQIDYGTKVLYCGRSKSGRNRCQLQCNNRTQFSFHAFKHYNFICRNDDLCDTSGSRETVTFTRLVDTCEIAHHTSKSLEAESLPYLMKDFQSCSMHQKFCSISIYCRKMPRRIFGHAYILKVMFEFAKTAESHDEDDISGEMLTAGAKVMHYNLRRMLETSIINEELTIGPHPASSHILRVTPRKPRLRLQHLPARSCVPGTYFNITLSTCLPCKFGTYQFMPNAVDCVPCPSSSAAWGSGHGSSTSAALDSLAKCPDLCDKGTYHADGLIPASSSQCIPCPHGTYQNDRGRTTCIECGKNLTTNLMGSMNFQDCRAQEFCPPGYYYEITRDVCEQCPIGYYQGFSGYNFCIRCPGNRVTDSTGSRSQKDCKSVKCIMKSRGRYHGYFQSPNWPEKYPRNAMCTWRLRPSSGRSMLLIIPEIDLPNDDCKDYIVIRKNRHATSRATFEECSSRTDPYPVKARTDKLFIEFRSRSDHQGTGFRIYFAMFEKQHEALVQSIIEDHKLFAANHRDKLLKNPLLLDGLLEIIADPQKYFKYANQSGGIFPQSVIRVLQPKVQYHLFGRH